MYKYVQHQTEVSTTSPVINEPEIHQNPNQTHIDTLTAWSVQLCGNLCLLVFGAPGIRLWPASLNHRAESLRLLFLREEKPAGQ